MVWPDARLKVLPLMASLGGGDHQFISEPTNGTCLRTPWKIKKH